MNYYLVFQNKSYKEEFAGSYLWAPQYTSAKRELFHWKNVSYVKKGDVILHCVKQRIVAISKAINNGHSEERPSELKDKGSWDKQGWKVEVEYNEIKNPLITVDHQKDIISLQPHYHAPFNRVGNGNEGYLYQINEELYKYITEKTVDLQTTEREKSYFKKFIDSL